MAVCCSVWRFRRCVQHQRYGAHLGIPWGISESAYFEQDNQLAFQYGPFGVPQLALRRTPLEDQVVAPYASVLALMVDLPAALANLRELERQGARDRLGFIEALDFSESRLDTSSERRRVFTYMAHHQGMSMLSLCNLLRQGAPQGWFERSPKAHAARALMHECLPREIVYQAGAIPRPLHKPGIEHHGASLRVIDPTAAFPSGMPTALLGYGSYGVNLRPNGAGQSLWNGLAISRSRDDLLRDVHGHWVLCCVRKGKPISTPSPARPTATPVQATKPASLRSAWSLTPASPTGIRKGCSGSARTTRWNCAR